MEVTTTITISSAATDPGDGIKTVEELANLLNSGLMTDGKINIILEN